MFHHRQFVKIYQSFPGYPRFVPRNACDSPDIVSSTIEKLGYRLSLGTVVPFAFWRLSPGKPWDRNLYLDSSVKGQLETFRSGN